MTESIELFPFDFGEFRNFDPIDAAGEVEKLKGLLADFGVELTRPWQVPMGERGADAVEDRFGSWGAGSKPTVLYWIGHGWATARDAALAHARSPEPVGTSGVEPKAMAAAISKWEAKTPDTAWLWVVIDACKSARFAELLAAELDELQGPRRIAILGTSAASSTTLGAFTRELSAALRHTFGGNETIPLTQLVDELRRTVRGARRVLNLDPETVLRRTVPPVEGYTGALDDWAELNAVVRDLPDDERRHFLPKAQGGELRGDSDMLGEVSWHFKGREGERRQLVKRMGSGGLVVVTGRAGSGKSAILGDLVVRSQPKLAKVLENRRLIKPTLELVPPLDASLQLTGLDTAGVLARLSAPLGVSPPDPSLPLTAQLDELMAGLVTRPTSRSAPTRIVVDALDEAVDPLQLAAALRRVGASPGVTLVVGTRRSTHEGPDLPDPADRDLLDALGVSDERTILVERDPGLAFDYVLDRLRPLAAAGKASGEQITSAARAIAQIEQEFLYARLAAYELLNRPELVARPDLIARLGADHRSVFAGAVARLEELDRQYRPLLTALALAQGRGLPIRDGVWAAVASAIDGTDIAEPAIHRLLEVAAPYLALDVEHGQTVYRLAHRTFAEHLTADPDEVRTQHAVIVTRATAELGAHPPANQHWNQYWVHHTSAHCAEAGPAAWRELDQAPALDLLDPRAVARDAMRALFGRRPLPPNIAAGVFAADSLVADPLAQRPATRRLARFRVAPTPVAVEHPPHRPWWPVWADTPQHPVHAILTGHTDWVWTVTTLPMPDGRILLATGSNDATVRLWDPSTGQLVRSPITDHTGGVSAAAAVSLPDGRTLLATGSKDETVRLWDPASGKSTEPPLTTNADRVRAVTAVTLPDGRTLLATGGDDHTVRLWDPATGNQIGGRLTGHTGRVWAVTAVTLPGGRTLLATGGDDHTVRLWDPATGNQVGGPLAGHTGRVWAVTPVTLPGGRTLLATGSNDHTVRLWDPATGQPIGNPITGHTGWVRAVAAYRCPTAEPCSPPDPTTRPCGCGTPPPANPSGIP